MFSVLRRPVFRRLFLAAVVALLGTGLASVALGLLAFRLAGDHAGQVLGTVFAIKMVAYVLVAPVAAAALSRLGRRTVLIGSDILRLTVALGLPFVTQVWQVYLLVFVLQAASATFLPTVQAVLPRILPDEDDYTAALSLSRLIDDLETVLSPMLAAALLLLIPAAALFFGTAAGFAGSALLVLSLGSRALGGGSAPPDPTAGEEEGAFLSRVGGGVRLFLATPGLRPVLLLNLAVAAVVSFVLVQTVVIGRSVLGGGDDLVAVLLAVNGAGSMAAALLLPRLLRRTPDRTVLLAGVAVLVVAGAAVAACLAGHVGWLPIAMLWFVIGVGWCAAETPIGRVIRRNVPAAALPSAFAAQFSLSHACWLITYPLAGWLGAADLGRCAAVLAGVALLAGIGVVATWPARRPAVVR